MSDTALLIMDYQHMPLGMISGAEPLPGRAAEAVASARERAVHVGFVRIALEDTDAAAVSSHNKMVAPLASGGYMREGSAEAAIHDGLTVGPDDISVRKTRVGAFSTTNLDEELRARGVTTVLLAGVATSGVVLTTVREAADRDYRVAVVSDLCADPDPEVHDVLMTKVFPMQADVMTTAGLAAEPR